MVVVFGGGGIHVTVVVVAMGSFIHCNVVFILPLIGTDTVWLLACEQLPQCGGVFWRSWWMCVNVAVV